MKLESILQEILAEKEYDEKLKNIFSSDIKVEEKIKQLIDLGYTSEQDISKLIKKYGSL